MKHVPGHAAAYSFEGNKEPLAAPPETIASAFRKAPIA